MVHHVPVVVVVLERCQSAGALHITVLVFYQYRLAQHLLGLLQLLLLVLLLLLLLLHTYLANHVIFGGGVFHGGGSGGGRCIGGHESTVVVGVLRFHEARKSVAQHTVEVERR